MAMAKRERKYIYIAITVVMKNDNKKYIFKILAIYSRADRRNPVLRNSVSHLPSKVNTSRVDGTLRSAVPTKVGNRKSFKYNESLEWRLNPQSSRLQSDVIPLDDS